VYLGADSALLSLKRGWRISGRYPLIGDECLVGAAVARTLKLTNGSKFTLPGIGPKSAIRSGTVCGVLAPTNDSDDTFIFMPLTTAQTMFQRPKQLTHVLVKLTDPNMVERVVGDLHGCDAGMDMNVVPLAHVFHTIQDLVNTTRILLGSVALVALLMAGAGVSNTILMAVTERTREIGVMRAVGASRADVFRLVWLETVVVCLAGGAAGLVAAGIGAPHIETWLRSRLPFSPTGTMVHTDPAVMALCMACAIVLGTFAGLLPAFRAARLSPVEAMRAGIR
jgi:putative ABC transport system permease protein